MTPCQTLCQCMLLSTWSRAGVKLQLVQVSLKGEKKDLLSWKQIDQCKSIRTKGYLEEYVTLLDEVIFQWLNVSAKLKGGRLIEKQENGSKNRSCGFTSQKQNNFCFALLVQADHTIPLGVNPVRQASLI